MGDYAGLYPRAQNEGISEKMAGQDGDGSLGFEVKGKPVLEFEP